MLAVLILSLMASTNAASVPVGKVYGFESANYNTYSIKHAVNQLVYIHETNYPSHFKIVPGLVPGGISFQCEDDHKYYLRHQNFVIKAHPDDRTDLFKRDATFLVVPGLNGNFDHVSFQSVNYNTSYIRHEGFQLKLHSGESELFLSDASWVPVEFPLLQVGWSYLFQSVNYPEYSIRHLINKLVKLEPNGDGPTSFNAVAGLYDSSAISFQCTDIDNYYLRHQDFVLKTHAYNDSESFEKDATFIVEYGLDNGEGTVSLKSWNYPTHYIRHQNFQLKLHVKADDDRYKSDATWTPILFVPKGSVINFG